MAYQKPSVTVTQLQKTFSPNYPEPDFQSCVVGPGYYWQDPARDDSEISAVYDTPYDGAQLVIPISDFTEHTNVITGTVIVELVRTKGSNGPIGEVIALEEGDISLDGEYAFDDTTEEITIAADIAPFDSVTEDDVADVRVGFLSARDDMTNQFEKITEPQQIRDWVGEPVTFNPLAFGAELMLANSGAATHIIGTDATVDAQTQDHGNAVATLANKDIYSIAPLTQVEAENEKYLTHVVEMSQPENGKNRLVVTNRDVTSYSTAEFPTVTEKDETAQVIQDYAATKQEKRFINVHPDGGFIEERRHVSTLRQSFIQAVFGDQFDLLPRFVSSRSVGSKKYKAFQEIDTAVIDNLLANDIRYITVYAPVPGYYFSTAVAGQISGKAPEAPLTNSGINGLSKVYRSNDYFSENQLDTIAEGGNWIIEELSANALINRHQLSTDTTSKETQEVSITTALDHVTFYYQDLFKGMIGRHNITPALLENMNAMANHAAEQLAEAGVIESINVIELYQDEAQPDTVKLNLSVEVLYPVNAIDITLTF